MAHLLRQLVAILGRKDQLKHGALKAKARFCSALFAGRRQLQAIAKPNDLHAAEWQLLGAERIATPRHLFQIAHAQLGRFE